MPDEATTTHADGFVETKGEQMDTPPSDDRALIEQVAALRDWMLENAPIGPCDSAVKAHLAGYATDEQIASWITLYRDTVIPAIPNFQGSTGVDFGCWTGIGSSILASLGAARVFCAEVNAHTMRFGPKWTNHCNANALRFLWNADGIIPLPDDSVDWVYVNQVFCNMHPQGFDQAIREISRILKTDARLVFCDSNNPHCPATLERLERIYKTRELGNGDHDNPAGVLYKQRTRIIEKLVPGINADDASRLAKNTCYLGGPDLDRAILAWKLAGTEPTSPFRGGWSPAPVNPVTGIAAGNITDPYDLAARFQSRSVKTSINTTAAQGPPDPAELHERMTASQSFYILGRKLREPLTTGIPSQNFETPPKL
jgi:SAM-dependent methyltransferase